MAGIELHGLDELRTNFKAAGIAAEKALEDAEDAAANVFRRAIRGAAPRGKASYPWKRGGKTYQIKNRRPIGQLARSVGIFISRDRKALTGSTRRRVLVGPGKKTGFYGYWLEEGWQAPLGEALTYTTERGDRWNEAGHTYTTRRRRRGGKYSAHSQMGLGRTRMIPGRPWFSGAISSSQGEAMGEMADTFNERMNRELERVG